MSLDHDYLASTHVGTPDPRQDDPPLGQRLLVSWKFPGNIFNQGLKLVMVARFWDQSEEVIEQILERSWSYLELYFPSKLLTYKVEVFNFEGDKVGLWEHHFWTQLIDIDLEKESKSSSVSSQPMQESVIETP